MTDLRKRLPQIALAALVAQIPFELRYTLLGLSNLQWTFLAAVVVSVPLCLGNWKELLGSRLVQAAALFVVTQWLAASLAPEFHANAFKSAIRSTAGFALLIILRIAKWEKPLCRVWAISAGVAALYALSAYAGFGLPWLFRADEFYLGQIQRLSGSFEYPNTAAAYFAMSLPIVWWSSLRRVWKGICVTLMWAAVTLTFSKGALVAVPLVVLTAVILDRSKAIAWRSSATLAGLGVLAYVAMLPVSPYLYERVYGPGVRNPLAAVYTTPWNSLRQKPNADDVVPLQIRNTGVTKWSSQGLRRVAVSYRWWDAKTYTFLKDRTPLVTRLPHDVGRGETVEVQAAFQTPEQPGEYMLVLELFSRNFDWFAQTGVVPVLLHADIHLAASRTTEQTDLTPYYTGERFKNVGDENAVGKPLTAAVSRLSLWRAGLEMFVAHPLGVGPDNYRLEYGKYLGAPAWNTQIYSNNLYLELLTGSGFLGLGAFVLTILAMQWRADAVCLAVAVFLVHGLVDVFLMTTPIYFAFWMLAGMRKEDV